MQSCRWTRVSILCFVIAIACPLVPCLCGHVTPVQEVEALAGKGSVCRSLRHAFLNQYPLVVRGGLRHPSFTSSTSSHWSSAAWTKHSLLTSYAQRPLATFLYDPQNPASTRFAQATLTVEEFLSRVDSPQHHPDVSPLNPSANLMIYALLTTRDQGDGSAGRDQQWNDVFHSVLNSFPKLLLDPECMSTSHTDESPLESGEMLVTWLSLRLASLRYQYPTHIDCLENLLGQLSGEKNVTLYHPKYVHDFQPQSGRKHWSSKSSSQVKHLESSLPQFFTTLYEGDILYIPFMFLHNVSTAGWSVGANVYFHSHQWQKFIQKRKPPEVNDYESRYESLC